MTYRSLISLTRRYWSSDSNVLHEIKFVRRFTQEDLDIFSQLTGDMNPIHSAAVPETDRLVNGALLNGVVAGMIGTKMPGPGTIVVAQKFSFPNKCRINENVEISLRLLQNRKISIVSYECRQNNKIVFEGEAKLMSDKANKIK